VTMTVAWREAILEHVFGNVIFPDLGDAVGLRGSTLAGEVFISAHTGDPGITADQETNEISFPAYARQGVPREIPGEWLRDNNIVGNVNTVQFPADTTGSRPLCTHLICGTLLSGGGTAMFTMQLAGVGIIIEPPPFQLTFINFELLFQSN
jgi:hypothetical protein